jgi:hypothetical protein|tara:strand:- start:230 stop:439 length:210 start_codon:yes stop_codon:yes gene_type:complete
MDSTIYKRGDIIMHPIAGKAWLHIAEVKKESDSNEVYYYNCVNQITGKKVILLAAGNDSIKLISKTRKE